MRAAATAAGKTLPSPAGVKTAPAITGARFVISATQRPANSGPPPISRRAATAGELWIDLFRRPREFRRRDHDLDTHTEIIVSPEDDIELRRVRITNRSRIKRAIDVTSYTEVVLASGAADIASHVQQSLRPDRDHQRPAGHSLFPAAAVRRRTCTMDVSFNGRSWSGCAESVL